MNGQPIAYTYRADNYCPDCILHIMIVHGDASPAVLDRLYDPTDSLESILDYLADCQAIDRADERTFDSGEFPKVIFTTENDEHCGLCKCPIGD